MGVIAVTGYKGRLGSELIRRGCMPMEVDVRNRYDIYAAVQAIKPDIVINCAAYTDVNDCETPEGYKRGLDVNYFGTKNLRDSFSGLLIHISTDYIWDGKRGPYTEEAKFTKPVNMYGLTKQGAEQMLMVHDDKPYCIVRTTCLYETYQRKDFVSEALQCLEDGRFEANTELSGNPTYVPHLVDALLRLADLSDKPKVVHLAGRECLTRYEFALMIATVFGYDKKKVIPSKEHLWISDPPKRGGFKVGLAEKLGLPIYSVYDGLEQYRKDLK